MAKIIKTNSTTKMLDSLKYDSGRNATLPFSSIGEECLRRLWYTFHWVFPVEGALSAKGKRIFSVGQTFEKIAIDELKAIGCEIFKLVDGKVEPLTGEVKERQEVFLGATGHSKGKPDGRILGIVEAPRTEHLLEIKTMNDKNFKLFVKQGLERQFPKYYAQCQRLMLEMDLTRAFVLAINKDSSDYHFERIKFDKAFARNLVRKEVHILTSDATIDKAYPKDHHKCTYCPAKQVCDGNEEPEQNCRTCEYSDMENEGKWFCTNPTVTDGGKKKVELSYKEQIRGCSWWEKGWEL